MPVSEALRRLSEDPNFWSLLLAGPSAPLDDRDLRTSLPVTGGYALVHEIGLTTGEQSLGLRVPSSSEPVQLAWTEPGRPQPAALRWHELDLFARVIALEDPTLPHPGLVVALLSPFAPVTLDDDPDAAASIKEAAFRSLRREVPPPAPSGPEQAPLPLFASADWWPAVPAPSPQVLDEATIAAGTTPAQVQLEVRTGSRFPREDLADLVRLAAARLARQREDRCYADARPLAERMAATGDLRPVPQLLGTLTEAGCDHPTVLDALSEPLEPLQACWMIETLAGVVPGTLLRHHL